MAKYIYSALKTNNQIVKGEIEALNPREAREKIRELGFIPTKVYTCLLYTSPSPRDLCRKNTAIMPMHSTVKLLI